MLAADCIVTKKTGQPEPGIYNFHVKAKEYMCESTFTWAPWDLKTIAFPFSHKTIIEDLKAELHSGLCWMIPTAVYWAG